ncbi:hypothetical protein U9M48_021969 [Paspalum notatum var. saurae]|uniref:Uncharacterized protein n=1 Tax=Paspalum notatum var. saurae TaxID=547442 RepID=A0AAQ3TK71_PASNO
MAPPQSAPSVASAHPGHRCTAAAPSVAHHCGSGHRCCLAISQRCPPLRPLALLAAPHRRCPHRLYFSQSVSNSPSETPTPLSIAATPAPPQVMFMLAIPCDLPYYLPLPSKIFDARSNSWAQN